MKKLNHFSPMSIRVATLRSHHDDDDDEEEGEKCIQRLCSDAPFRQSGFCKTEYHHDDGFPYMIHISEQYRQLNTLANGVCHHDILPMEEEVKDRWTNGKRLFSTTRPPGSLHILCTLGVLGVLTSSRSRRQMCFVLYHRCRR